MKKILVYIGIVLAGFLFVSCAGSKQARTYKRTLDGNWQLKTINTEGIRGNVKIQLLNEADFSCFTGGVWNFNARNNLGTYTVTGGNQCTAVARNIRWSVYEEGTTQYLQLKRLDDNLKTMDEGNGFRLAIVQLDQNRMQLKSNITFEGRPVTIIYNFERN